MDALTVQGREIVEAEISRRITDLIVVPSEWLHCERSLFSLLEGPRSNISISPTSSVNVLRGCVRGTEFAIICNSEVERGVFCTLLPCK